MLEGWGGEVPVVQVSATKRQGIEDLLEVILLVVEMADLKVVPEGAGGGTLLDAPNRPAKQREEQMAGSRKVSLEGLMDKIKSEEVQALNVVLKADAQGSVEVLRDTLAKLSP